MAERTPTRFLTLVTRTTSSRSIARVVTTRQMLLKKYTRVPRPFLPPPTTKSFPTTWTLATSAHVKEPRRWSSGSTSKLSSSHAAGERNRGTGGTAPRPRATAGSEPEAGCWYGSSVSRTLSSSSSLPPPVATASAEDARYSPHRRGALRARRSLASMDNQRGGDVVKSEGPREGRGGRASSGTLDLERKIGGNEVARKVSRASSRLTPKARPSRPAHNA